MKKKLLSIMLILAMTITLLTGCGSSDDNKVKKAETTYFDQLKEMSTITTGTTTLEMGMYGPGDNTDGVMLDKEGNMSARFKITSTKEENQRVAVKLEVQLGQSTEYKEATTLVFDQKTLYIDCAAIIDFVKSIDEESAKSVEQTLSQLGVKGYASIDLKKVLEELNQKMPENTQEIKEDSTDLIEELIKALEKNFGDLQGVDGDEYTLTINSDNADKAVEGAKTFLKEDAESLINKSISLIKKASTDSDLLDSAFPEDDVKESISSAIEELEDNKEEFVSTIKENNISIVSKANVKGNKGSRKGSITFATGNIKDEDGKVFNADMNITIDESANSIADMIPEDAMDVTSTILMILQSQQGAGLAD